MKWRNPSCTNSPVALETQQLYCGNVGWATVNAAAKAVKDKLTGDHKRKLNREALKLVLNSSDRKYQEGGIESFTRRMRYSSQC